MIYKAETGKGECRDLFFISLSFQGLGLIIAFAFSGFSHHKEKRAVRATALLL